MAQYDHLRLVRLPEQLERRKTGGGQAPVRNAPVHGARIRSELNAVIETQKRRRRPDAVNPSLILRVQMSGPLLEPEWEKVGLTVLSTDPDRTLVLFSTTDDLTEFRERLEAFSLGAPEGQKGPSFAAFIGGIETIGDVEPRDRIGPRLKEEGFNSPDDFLADDPYRLDIELWDLGRRDQRTQALEDITAYVQARGGEILDQYVGPSITMVRIEATGTLIRTLLTIEEIATIDRPPQPDLEVAELLQLTLADIPPFEPDGDDLPVIGVIDSGLNAHPLLDDIVVGSIGVPASLGTADDLGHGTRVAGVAIFGDLRVHPAVLWNLERVHDLADVALGPLREDDEDEGAHVQLVQLIRTHPELRREIFRTAFAASKRPQALDAYIALETLSARSHLWQWGSVPADHQWLLTELSAAKDAHYRLAIAEGLNRVIAGLPRRDRARPEREARQVLLAAGDHEALIALSPPPLKRLQWFYYRQSNRWPRWKRRQAVRKVLAKLSEIRFGLNLRLRLSANGEDAVVVVEIKRALPSVWSGDKLMEHLQVQLVDQYLPVRRARHGVYLVIQIGDERSWRLDGMPLTFAELGARLRSRADTLVRDHAHLDALTVLTPIVALPPKSTRKPRAEKAKA